MKKLLVHLCFIGMVLLGASQTLAQEADPNSVAKITQNKGVDKSHTDMDFDTVAANKTFDLISLKLSTQNLNLKNMQEAVAQLEDLLNLSQKCIDTGEGKLDEINTLIKSSEIENITQQQRNDLKYLNDKKNQIGTHVSECRLFIFRAKEATDAYKKTISDMSASQNFERNYPIWQVLEFLPNLTFSELDYDKLYKLSGLSHLNTANLYFITWLCIVASLLSFYVRIRCKRFLRYSLGNHPFWDSFIETSVRYVLPITLMSMVSLFLLSIHEGVEPSLIANLSFIILGYTAILASFRTLLASSSHRSFITGIQYVFAKKLYQRIFWVGLLILLGLLSYEVLKDQPQAELISSAFYSIYLTLLSLGVSWLFWLFTTHPFIQRQKPILKFLFKFFLVFLLFSLMVINFVGYHRLTFFILSSLIYTAALVSILLALVRYFVYAFKTVIEAKNPHVVKFWHKIGVFGSKDIIEIYLIRVGAYVSLYFAAFLVLLNIWGGNSIQADMLLQVWEKGFTIFHFTVNPSKLVMAMLVFSLIHLLTRYIANHITLKHRYDGEKDTQVALASITSYVGFAFALAVALIVSGVDFTGIALVAGALSVGIGLGLQGIVNNFFSGIILLLEKPIKPGDRIMMGDLEGFVKKIRIRSTRITTVFNEDIIVPNSELISNKVINYMYHDRSILLKVSFEVAYDSDVGLVKSIIYKAAKEHPEVFEKESAPIAVLLTSFGESNLVFELLCMIKNVNSRMMVASDLRQSVFEEFNKHNVEISFPRRNVQLKPLESPKTKDISKDDADDLGEFQNG